MAAAPALPPPAQVVPGWELAVLGGQGVPAVKEGGIRSVTIPPELAYGQGEPLLPRLACQSSACLLPRLPLPLCGAALMYPPARPPPRPRCTADGYSCLYGLSTSCRVPPGSAVEITFEYKGLGY